MIHVSLARPDQFSTALTLMFSRSPAAEQSAQVREVLAACGRGEISLDGLLLAEQNGTPVGAGLYVMQPDKTAFVWPPVVVDHLNPARVTDAIYAELRQQVDAAEAWLSQCLVEVDDTSERSTLERNEFGHLADLHYLERLVSDPLPSDDAARLTTLDFVPEENSERFATLIEQTYVGTLDCPGLKGTRTGLEALACHQLSGEFDPSRWSIYCFNGDDIGLLLMNDHSDQDAWEVVYMGVVPDARGNGFGRAIIIDGIRRVRDAGRRALLLAVDGRNTFARDLYASLGFREIATRSAHVRVSPARVR